MRLMTNYGPTRTGLARVLLAVALMTLLGAVPALSRTPSASAQVCLSYNQLGQCQQYTISSGAQGITSTPACIQYSPTPGPGGTAQCTQYAAPATSMTMSTPTCVQYSATPGAGGTAQCLQYSSSNPITVIGTGTTAAAAATPTCVQYSSTPGPGGVAQCVQYSSAATSTTAAATTPTCVQYSSTPGPGGSAQCLQYSSSTTPTTASTTTMPACIQYSSTPGSGGTAQCTQYSSSNTPSASSPMTSPTTSPTTAASTTATTVNSCPAGQFLTASGCSASTVQQTCPGSGIAVTPAPGQSLTQACPVVCYGASAFPQILSAGSTCPSGTSSTPPGGTASTSGSGSAATNTNLSSTPTSSAGGGLAVTMNAGWNIVAGPTGTILTGSGPTIFTLQSTDNGNYESLANTTPLTAGEGYWAQFSSATTVMLPNTPSGSTTVPLPAGQPVMIGNGGDTVATVTGVDSLMVWDPVQQIWTQTTSMKPGQGGFATSNAGGQATITWGSTAPASGALPAAPAS